MLDQNERSLSGSSCAQAIKRAVPPNPSAAAAIASLTAIVALLGTPGLRPGPGVPFPIPAVCFSASMMFCDSLAGRSPKVKSHPIGWPFVVVLLLGSAGFEPAFATLTVQFRRFAPHIWNSPCQSLSNQRLRTPPVCLFTTCQSASQPISRWAPLGARLLDALSTSCQSATQVQESA